LIAYNAVAEVYRRCSHKKDVDFSVSIGIGFYDSVACWSKRPFGYKQHSPNKIHPQIEHVKSSMHKWRPLEALRIK
jgi:hypothetical protein